MEVDLTIPNARLWMPGTRALQAHLYTANLTLTSQNQHTVGISSSGGSDRSGGPAVPLDTRSTRFGVKSVRTDGPRIIVNGEAVFLRGYGDDAGYASTAAPPMNKGYYLDQLRDMKALGFNFIRFHTHGAFEPQCWPCITLFALHHIICLASHIVVLLANET